MLNGWARKAAICLCVFAGMLPAAAETFLTEAQALKLVFPKSESVAAESRTLTASQREQLEQASRLHFPEKGYRFFLGRTKGQVDGYALIVNEIGKHEYITFIVGVSAKGEVTEVAVMDFRESRGGEVREPRFVRQFRGKKASDAVQVDRDVVNYTGATLSSHALARGVKKALLLAQLFYGAGKK